MYLNEFDILHKGIAVIKQILASEEYCTIDAINGVLLLMDSLLEKEGE